MIEDTAIEKIKELRAQTGAGIKDCKQALDDSQGQINIAIDNLRKKGLASADKKASRIAAEGVIESYIHSGSRIGVLVEINCETDFVAREIKFKELAKNIAMQIAASPNIQFVSTKNIPENVINHEISIESAKEDLANKPADIKEKILSGRIEKRLKDLSLMNQPFIKDTNLSIEELVKQHISLLGENIQIRRFKKFILGDGLEKRNENFANEVAQIIKDN
uniref:Elongation factor Ts, mitochondrial n=1 Tax=Campylaephora sungminbooi TaxID=1896769 RepID=A0A1B0RRR7_9FLOR|nr:elongation factor Ts [Campylaephora sungminbooi]AKU47463.1 elongation factor Ts [Campylaephora sungminbooi]ALN11910.1 elongation factor Ts [Campylaephora sungminbooi]